MTWNCTACPRQAISDKLTTCTCGAPRPAPADISDPMPTLADVVNAVAGAMAGVRCEVLPEPDAPSNARWLLKRFAPHAPEEAPRRVRAHDGKSSRWDWPYLHRCRYLARKFVRRPVAEQQYIVAAAEDGIDWRGDDFDTFQHIVDEHYRLREIGVEAYRREALGKMRALIVRRATRDSADVPRETSEAAA